jgi:hypothetical protein
MQLVIANAGDHVDHHHPVEHRSGTLLSHLQSDVRADRPPSDADHDRPLLDPADRSVQVHACAVDTVYAMTIHKSQGSQFDTTAVLLPAPTSRILTRELLYTAATKARRRLIVAGTEEAVRAAVERPIARASGLRVRLWLRSRRPGDAP